MRSIALILPALLVLTCLPTYKVTVMTGQVASLPGAGAPNATILLGQASIQYPGYAPTPDPLDTLFLTGVFPVGLDPIEGAEVRINSGMVPERLSGIYFQTLPPAIYPGPADLEITFPGEPGWPTIRAHAVLPETFSLVAPAPGESLDRQQVLLAWSRSDSARAYYVHVGPTDTLRQARGLLQTTRDTTLQVPPGAFSDSFLNPLPGDYVARVWAVYGGWNQAGFPIHIGGSVQNAVGLFGAATYARPIVFRVLPDTAQLPGP